MHENVGQQLIAEDGVPAYIPARVGSTPASQLSDRHELFVQELMRNGCCLVDAYKAVYPKHGTETAAFNNACRLRARQDVRERISELTRLAAQVAVIDRAVLLQELHEVATADPAEISRIVTTACASCWSDPLAVAAVLDLGEIPDTDAPRGACEACRGRGVQRVIHTDTASLRGPARRLYQGAKVKSDGSIEVQIVDQLAARKELHALLGMRVERSVSLNLNADIKPLKRGMTVEEALAIMEEVAPLSEPDDPNVVSQQ
jgi:phage terminase small subunit